MIHVLSLLSVSSLLFSLLPLNLYPQLNSPQKSFLFKQEEKRSEGSVEGLRHTLTQESEGYHLTINDERLSNLADLPLTLTPENYTRITLLKTAVSTISYDDMSQFSRLKAFTVIGNTVPLTIESTCFNNCPELRALIINNSRLTALESSFMGKNADKLQYLFLAHNALASLPCFDEYTNLRVLDCSFNALTHLPALHACKNLILFLADNNHCEGRCCVYSITTSIQNIFIGLAHNYFDSYSFHHLPRRLLDTLSEAEKTQLTSGATPQELPSYAHNYIVDITHNTGLPSTDQAFTHQLQTMNHDSVVRMLQQHIVTDIGNKLGAFLLTYDKEHFENPHLFTLTQMQWPLSKMHTTAISAADFMYRHAGKIQLAAAIGTGLFTGGMSALFWKGSEQLANKMLDEFLFTMAKNKISEHLKKRLAEQAVKIAQKEVLKRGVACAAASGGVVLLKQYMEGTHWSDQGMYVQTPTAIYTTGHYKNQYHSICQTVSALSMLKQYLFTLLPLYRFFEKSYHPATAYEPTRESELAVYVKGTALFSPPLDFSPQPLIATLSLLQTLATPHAGTSLNTVYAPADTWNTSATLKGTTSKHSLQTTLFTRNELKSLLELLEAFQAVGQKINRVRPCDLELLQNFLHHPGICNELTRSLDRAITHALRPSYERCNALCSSLSNPFKKDLMRIIRTCSQLKRLVSTYAEDASAAV